MIRSLEDVRAPTRSAKPSGRIPPNNIEAEESLLGAMLLSRDAIGTASELLGEEDFYSPAHSTIFASILELDTRGDPADPVTVADDLRRSGLIDAVGGAAKLSYLASTTPAIRNVERYARIVEEHSLLRKLIAVANDVAEIGYSVPDDISEAIDRAESMVFSVADRRGADTLRWIHDLLGESMDRLEALYERGKAVTGVPTGYRELDEILAGLQPSNLVIMGARPGMGKTSCALGMLTHAALEARVPSLFFSLEMSHMEITQRILCAEARVDATRMRSGHLSESDWQRLQHAIGRLGEAPIYIDDNPALTVMDIRAKARRMRASHQLGLVVVDYLQLMSGRHNAESRQVEISEISRNLKILARELNVPIVALSQLSRALEGRGDSHKRPMLADLRESGSLEQDADVVLFIYRDEIYNPESEDRGIAEIIVSKHRNGPTGTSRLAFLQQYTKFANMAQV